MCPCFHEKKDVVNVLADLPDALENLDDLAPLEKEEVMVTQDVLVTLDDPDLVDHLDLMVDPALMATLVTPDLLENLAQLEAKDPQDQMGHPDLQDPKVCLDHLATKPVLDDLATLDHPGPLDKMATEDHPDPQAHPDLVDHLEKMPNIVLAQDDRSFEQNDKMIRLFATYSCSLLSIPNLLYRKQL